MKNLIIGLISFIMLLNAPNILGADSNSDYRDKLSIGVKGGLNLSNVYDTQGDNFIADSKLGVALGGFISIPLGNTIGIQPELLISQRGYNRKGSILGANYELSHSKNYLDIPILFAFKPTEMFTILAGPQFSYLASESNTFTSGGSVVTNQQDFENENVRKNTLCFTGGFDLYFDQIVASGRVGWDILNNNGDGTETNPRYKNSWYQITVGFRF